MVGKGSHPVSVGSCQCWSQHIPLFLQWFLLKWTLTQSHLPNDTKFLSYVEILCGEAKLDTLPALENGYIVTAPRDKKHIQFGDSIQYSCNDGYHLTGNPTIQCTERGFTDLPKCESKLCLFISDRGLSFNLKYTYSKCACVCVWGEGGFQMGCYRVGNDIILLMLKLSIYT